MKCFCKGKIHHPIPTTQCSTFFLLGKKTTGEQSVPRGKAPSASISTPKVPRIATRLGPSEFTSDRWTDRRVFVRVGHVTSVVCLFWGAGGG